MLILLSPAKSLDYESRVPTRKHTEPRMLDEAAALIDVMRTKTVDELADLMSISMELADLNARRYADFSPPFTLRNARQAAFAFDGDVYRGMDARGSMDGRDLAEAQKTVRVLSGLYGVLRPLDLVQPYRLEMGTKLRTERGDTLYEWWGSRITDVLNADLAASPGPPVVVNLASGEYFRSVDTDRLDGTLVSPRFLDQAPDGRYKIISFNAKWARGAMAGWMVHNRVRSAGALRRFDVAGYRYDPSRSTPAEPTFVRPRHEP
ncbi:MAG TPA: peroxide stress protein YaaA [Acidimicrobiales bacterium]|nr:peroxide stress protein YaaA [Acidimicrobiales bacterium]